MSKAFFTALCFAVLSSCQSQTPDGTVQVQADKSVGGPCEGCEAIFEYGDKQLSDTDTLPDFLEGQTKLKISGKVYQNDGKTPAAGVIIYIYHTDREGLYPAAPEAKGWAKRHGYIRGWIKTGASGEYTFYTGRPAAYPNSNVQEHIHTTIKESGKTAYYIDDFVFDDDPNLTPKKRGLFTNRGGAGIVRPIAEGNYFLINRDIILGLNIPGYD